MKKLLLITLLSFAALFSKAQNTVTLEAGTSPLSTYQLRYKAVTPDSLNHLWIYNGITLKYNRVFTATEANQRFAPAGSGVISVVGTTNRLTASPTAGNVVIDISATFEALLEKVANKASTYATVNNTLYPTIQLMRDSTLHPNKNLYDIANKTTARANLGLAIGTDVLAYRTFGTAANNNTSDFEVPLTFTYGLNRTGNNVKADSAVLKSKAAALADYNVLMAGKLGVSATAANSTLWNSQQIAVSALANGDVMQYDGAKWVNVTVSVTGPLQKSGAGVGGTWSITQATTSTPGYVSATDWNTFNNKQALITSGPVSVTAGVSALGKNIALNGGTPSASWGTNNNSIELIGGNGIYNSSINAYTFLGNNIIATGPVTAGFRARTGRGGALSVGLLGMFYNYISYGVAGSAISATQPFWVDTLGNQTNTGNIKYVVGSDATNDMYYRSSTGFLQRIAAGSNGYVLTSASGVPTWQPATGLTNPMINYGDIIFGGISGVPTRLALGGAARILGVNIAGTDLEYKSMISGVGMSVISSGTNITFAQSLPGYLSKTANYTVLTGDFTNGYDLTIYCDATAGNITITLPSIASFTPGGKSYRLTVIKTDSGVNAVTISGGATNINGATTQVLALQYAGAIITGDGTQFYSN